MSEGTYWSIGPEREVIPFPFISESLMEVTLDWGQRELAPTGANANKCLSATKLISFPGEKHERSLPPRVVHYLQLKKKADQKRGKEQEKGKTLVSGEK